jgi:hypothetical protein
MALVSAIITSVRYDINDPNSTAFADTELLDYLNRAGEHVHKLLIQQDSDLVKSKQTITLAEDDEDYSLESDYWTTSFAYVDGADTNLGRISMGELAVMPASSYQGEPKSYCIINDTFYVRPVPTSSEDGDSLYHWYFPKWTDLETTDNMPFNDLFNQAIRQFVAMTALNRDEYNVQVETGLLGMLEQEALKIAISRYPFVEIDPWAGGEYDPFEDFHS